MTLGEKQDNKVRLNLHCILFSKHQRCTVIGKNYEPSFLISFLFLLSFFKASASIHGTLLADASSQCCWSPRIHTDICGRGIWRSLDIAQQCTVQVCKQKILQQSHIVWKLCTSFLGSNVLQC